VAAAAAPGLTRSFLGGGDDLLPKKTCALGRRRDSLLEMRKLAFVWNQKKLKKAPRARRAICAACAERVGVLLLRVLRVCVKSWPASHPELQKRAPKKPTPYPCQSQCPAPYSAAEQKHHRHHHQLCFFVGQIHISSLSVVLQKNPLFLCCCY
jgi:hypothetical protein